jgi:hypothetical protein
VGMLFTQNPSILETSRQLTIPSIDYRNKKRIEQAKEFFDNFDAPYDFDEDLFCALVTQIYVESADKIIFHFRDGSQVRIDV